jgi:AcrR family transcriptional regulator
MGTPASTRAIPQRVRRSALSVLADWSVRADTLVRSLGQEQGFVTLGELADALQERFGRPEVAAFWGAFMSSPDVVVVRVRKRMTSVDPELRHYEAEWFAERTLQCVADPWFADALNIGHEAALSHAFELNRYQEADADVRERIEQLFARNGVPYSFGDDERMTRRGDPTLAAVAVQPALTLLDTPGLEEAKRRLLDAMAKAQAHRADDAIDTARKAVEEGLLALIAASDGVEVPRIRQANNEFNALVEGGALPDTQRSWS